MPTGSPASVAFWYQRAASTLFTGVPEPPSYSAPILFIAIA